MNNPGPQIKKAMPRVGLTQKEHKARKAAEQAAAEQAAAEQAKRASAAEDQFMPGVHYGLPGEPWWKSGGRKTNKRKTNKRKTNKRKN